jgi:hypothetical protein
MWNGVRAPAVRADKLCSTDTDTCISIRRIPIRGYVVFQKNLIHRYVLTIFLINS